MTEERSVHQSVVLVPFYRGAVVFITAGNMMQATQVVLVPFYRGAVVFTN